MIMIRVIDVLLATFGLILTSPLLLILIIVAALDTGSPIFSQVRVGREMKPFRIYKIRTMKIGTESVATHLSNPASITTIGRFLRRYKLDELPQLCNVIRQEMSIVGPRPCLFSQKDLINQRADYGIFRTLPGITGYAQLKGLDMSDPKKLVNLEARLVAELNLKTYICCIVGTLATFNRR
jgi:lipopolysaccharide/colanic/teichoic acid biosynthesis glycosyltransferase